MPRKDKKRCKSLSFNNYRSTCADELFNFENEKKNGHVLEQT